MYGIVVLTLLKVFHYGAFIPESAKVQAYIGGFLQTEQHNTYQYYWLYAEFIDGIDGF